MCPLEEKVISNVPTCGQSDFSKIHLCTKRTFRGTLKNHEFSKRPLDAPSDFNSPTRRQSDFSKIQLCTNRNFRGTLKNHEFSKRPLDSPTDFLMCPLQ